jgi:chromate transporter
MKVILHIFWVALRLGLTSFGGPIAHLGYFQEEYVRRRKWLDDKSYADVVALCQFLPGPASSQVGITIGMLRAGIPGGFAAWLGFTLPSALALGLFAYGIQTVGVLDTDLLDGLKIVAVAVVAQAVWSMSRNLAPDRKRGSIAILAAVAALSFNSAVGQLLIIIAGATVGWILLRENGEPDSGETITVNISKLLALISLSVFFIGLIMLPILRQLFPGYGLEILDSFYRSGSLVFGGGHVVLPLLQNEIVPAGWITQEQFIIGYGAAQAVPGPLFTFSAYVGALGPGYMNPILGSSLAVAAIFLPSFLLLIGVLPFWALLRSQKNFQSILRGVNAAVVGILLAALYDPIWVSAIHTSMDFALAAGALCLLIFWKVSPWLVVLLTFLGGVGLTLMPTIPYF